MNAGMIVRMAAMAAALAAGAAGAAWGQEKKGYEVHDMSRPQPTKVEPGEPSTQEKAGTAPSDAVVLFDGKDLSAWAGRDGKEAKWTIEDGNMTVAKGTGNIQTKEKFGDCQLHIEWVNYGPQEGTSQGRGNSGVFLMGLYECQILETYENRTYPDGMSGSLYGQFPPLVNALRPAGQWQTYDVIFRKPRFKDGKVEKPATFTVLLNGVLVQDHTEAIGPTLHKNLANYSAKHPETGPIVLQDHGHPVRFRNIWVRPLPAESEKPQAPVRAAGAGH